MFDHSHLPNDLSDDSCPRKTSISGLGCRFPFLKEELPEYALAPFSPLMCYKPDVLFAKACASCLSSFDPLPLSQECNCLPVRCYVSVRISLDLKKIVVECRKMTSPLPSVQSSAWPSAFARKFSLPLAEHAQFARSHIGGFEEQTAGEEAAL